MVVSLVMASRTPGMKIGPDPDIAQIPRTSWNGLPAAFRPMHKSAALGSVPRKVRTALSEYLATVPASAGSGSDPVRKLTVSDWWWLRQVPERNSARSPRLATWRCSPRTDRRPAIMPRWSVPATSRETAPNRSSLVNGWGVPRALASSVRSIARRDRVTAGVAHVGNHCDAHNSPAAVGLLHQQRSPLAPRVPAQEWCSRSRPPAPRAIPSKAQSRSATIAWARSCSVAAGTSRVPPGVDRTAQAGRDRVGRLDWQASPPPSPRPRGRLSERWGCSASRTRPVTNDTARAWAAYSPCE